MANRIKGITVEIGGDTTGLDKALKSVNSSITKTQSALNDVNRLLKTRSFQYGAGGAEAGTAGSGDKPDGRKTVGSGSRTGAGGRSLCPWGYWGRISIRRSSGRLRKPVES